jgi:outer membrane murein-binding lipoprotein Lpp
MDKKTEIIEEVERLREDYVSELEDEREEQFTLIDRINNLIKMVFNDSSQDVYTTLNPEALEKWKKAKLRRAISKFFSNFSIRKSLYFILLATITLFLVTEAVPFYAIGGEITAKTWLKAILTEVSFIFLSGYRTKGYIETGLVGLLRISIFCLMLFVISSEVALEGTRDISKIDNIASRIERLEKQVVKTEMDIQRYREINWPRNMTQSIRKREQLENQIQELRDLQVRDGASTEVAEILQYKMWGKAAFRLILMFIVVLVTRRIFKF